MSFKGVAFLLEVMTKSMILKIHSTGEISACPSHRFATYPFHHQCLQLKEGTLASLMHHHHHHHL
jgi:hypothetical protein